MKSKEFDLACPNPVACPVVVVSNLPKLSIVPLATSTGWWRCYDSTWGFDEFNAGFGDTRFAPFPDEAGEAVSSMYLAANAPVALLETIFHDVYPESTRLIFESDLRRKLLSQQVPPAAAAVIDLRDAALDKSNLSRDSLVTSSPEHYACTRRVAMELHRTYPNAQGLIWHSRQTELNGFGATEVVMLFGDRYGGENRGTWQRHGLGPISLLDGAGRLIVDSIATALDAVVVPDIE